MHIKWAISQLWLIEMGSKHEQVLAQATRHSGLCVSLHDCSCRNHWIPGLAFNGQGPLVISNMALRRGCRVVGTRTFFVGVTMVLVCIGGSDTFLTAKLGFVGDFGVGGGVLIR